MITPIGKVDEVKKSLDSIKKQGKNISILEEKDAFNHQAKCFLLKSSSQVWMQVQDINGVQLCNYDLTQ